MKKVLIVGSGLYGSILARELTDIGYKCHVIDKRDHTGGNCHTKKINNINVHVYGAHIFHTSNHEVWNYLLKHTTVNQYLLNMKLKFGDRMFSMPINLMTLNQLWNITTPTEAENKIKEVTKKYKKDVYNNAEEWALGNVGEEIYNIFYKEYLEKQWQKNPKDIPYEILARQVVRLNYNDNYYYDTYQGMPNYTKLFNSLLDGISIDLNTDYLENRDYFDSEYDRIIYTGPIDQFYSYEFGELEYKSLRFENETLPIKDFQGTSVISYPEKKYNFSRIIEHKHFEYGKQDSTVITREYPQKWERGVEPYYPFNNNRNKEIYNKYVNNNKNDYKYIFGGRLGLYQYLDMDDTIEKALELVEKFK